MKKSILVLCFLAALTLISNYGWAQQRSVSGRVTSSEDGSALPGVNVLIKGTKQGVSTDGDGKFSINVPSANTTLVFSFIGFDAKEVAVGNQTSINASLTPNASELNEVVVVGYGTQYKRDVSGSISSIGGKQIAQLPVQSFEQALGGRAAGVNITVPNGLLNNPPVIRVRGVNSINLSSFPLVVIDGIPAFTDNNSTSNAPNNPLGNINPSDIESVEVLKDASASAIYGSRASAGVILVTTKRGTKGRGKFTYDAWVGVTQPFRLFDMLNADQYMMMKNEAVRNLNANVLAVSGKPGTNIEGFRPSLDANGNPVNTNWYDYVYQNGVSHSNSASFSGGNDNTSYYLSLGYTGQKGMLQKNEFKRTSARLNVDHKVYKTFKVGTSFGYANSYNSSPNSGSIPGAAFSTAGLGRLPLVLPPNVAAYNNDGSYNINGSSLGAGANVNPASGAALLPGYYNPVVDLDKNSFTSESNDIQGSVYADWEIIKGLNIRTQYGINNIGFEDKSFLTGISGDGYSSGGSATNWYRTLKRWNWQNTAQYSRTIAEKHSVSLLVGAEEQRTQVERWGANRTTVADVFFESYQGNFTNIAVSGSQQTENYLVSYFGRLNYDFGKKYFASVNFRRDGYSAWASKWGNFYGAALGYTISEEPFWKNSAFLQNINHLKLTGSYGEVGNSNGIGDFASLQTYASGLYGAVATLGYNSAGNSALTWETSKKTDIGFSFGLLQDRLQGEFSYYKNLVDGLILDVPQAPSKGVPGNSVPANVGSMQNTGIEFSLQFNAITQGDFKWTINGNVTTLKNRVLALSAEGQRIGTATSLETINYTTAGRSVGDLLAVPSVGINPDNGRRMFRKADGTIVQYDHLGTGWTTVSDGKSTTSPSQLADGVYFGPVLPKWYGGLDNTFRYKGFDLGIFLQFSGGNYLYNGTKAGLRDQRFWNNHTDILNRWTPENKNGTLPRVVYGDNVSNGSALVISENIEKGDFLRARNLSLGYTFTRGLLDKLKIQNARIYGQVQNAFILTKYTGIDPEISTNGNSNTGAGIDRNSIGQARTFTLGINLGF